MPMNLARKIWANCSILLIAASAVSAAATNDEARVTRVIRDVELLAPEVDAKPAAVDDKVAEDTSVRTGVESRSELTFADLTITRLGENTTFTFKNAGRNVTLNEGSLLFYVPKDSGGAHLATDAVSVAITGTTIIFRARPDGRNILTILEGGARASLVKFPRQSVYVRAGQMIDVPPGAIKMPRPINVDLRLIMKSPLITDFEPLPSQNLILMGSNKSPAYRSHPVAGQSPGGGGYVPGPAGSGQGPGQNFPSGNPGGNNAGNPNNPNNPGKPNKPKKPGNPQSTPSPNAGNVGGQGGAVNVPNRPPSKPKEPVKGKGRPTPTPTPIP
ncbi:MAG: FecR family protein [Verrucomicrobiota bacterium]